SGFLHLDRYNLVVGESGLIVTPIDGLITYLATTATQDANTEMLELDRVGDESSAFVMILTEGEEPVRLEFLLFRRDQRIVQLMIGYPDGTEPEITMEELAELWDDRSSDPLERDASKVKETDCLEEGRAL